MAEIDPNSEALVAATERRVKLKGAVSAVETAASSPSAKPSWRGNLLSELDQLRLALDQHVNEVEGDKGLLAELTETAPRLVYKIDRVRDEHPGLVDQVAKTILRVETSDDVEEMRATVVDTLTAIVRHRQKGADLVYEGYSVDIGGS